MIAASCTWGIGPDVLIDLDGAGDNDAALLLEPATRFDRWTHGVCNHVQLDLTAEQARSLAAQLLVAAQTCDDLEAGLEALNNQSQE